MELLDLPPEILRAIVEQSVFTLGFLQAQRLRLGNKLFGREILQATFMTGILDPDPLRKSSFNTYPLCFLYGMTTSLMARYLQTRILTSEFSSELITTFRKVTEYLLIGSEQQSEQVLDEVVDVDTESQYFGKALHQAAFRGFNDVIRLLIERGANVNDDYPSDICSKSWQTTLQAACLGGHEETVRPLLGPEYCIPTSGEAYNYGLEVAAHRGHLNVIRILMETGTFREPTQLRIKILGIACHKGFIEIVCMMLDGGINVNTVYRPSFTPLLVAASRGYGKIVRLLLARGAHQRVRNYEDEDPLRKAVRGGWNAVAQILLEHGADINGQQQPSPLAIAQSSGHIHMIRFLLERGAKLHPYRSLSPKTWHRRQRRAAAACTRG